MLAKTTMGLVSGLALMLAAWPALAEGPLDEITIAYYTEWPIPVMAYKDSPKLEEELGVKVNWVSFETGTAMSAAMASGDVQIALSPGCAALCRGGVQRSGPATDRYCGQLFRYRQLRGSLGS